MFSPSYSIYSVCLNRNMRVWSASFLILSVTVVLAGLGPTLPAMPNFRGCNAEVTGHPKWLRDPSHGRRMSVYFESHGRDDLRELRSTILKGARYIKIDLNFQEEASQCRAQSRLPSSSFPFGCLVLTHYYTNKTSDFNTTEDLVLGFLNSTENQNLLKLKYNLLEGSSGMGDDAVLSQGTKSSDGKSPHQLGNSHDGPFQSPQLDEVGPIVFQLCFKNRPSLTSGTPGCDGFPTPPNPPYSLATKWLHLLDEFYHLATTVIDERQLRDYVTFVWDALTPADHNCISADRWPRWPSTFTGDHGDATAKDNTGFHAKFQMVNMDFTSNHAWLALGQHDYYKFADTPNRSFPYAFVAWEPSEEYQLNDFLSQYYLGSGMPWRHVAGMTFAYNGDPAMFHVYVSNMTGRFAKTALPMLPPPIGSLEGLGAQFERPSTPKLPESPSRNRDASVPSPSFQADMSLHRRPVPPVFQARSGVMLLCANVDASNASAWIECHVEVRVDNGRIDTISMNSTHSSSKVNEGGFSFRGFPSSPGSDLPVSLVHVVLIDGRANDGHHPKFPADSSAVTPLTSLRRRFSDVLWFVSSAGQVIPATLNYDVDVRVGNVSGVNWTVQYDAMQCFFEGDVTCPPWSNFNLTAVCTGGALNDYAISIVDGSSSWSDDQPVVDIVVSCFESALRMNSTDDVVDFNAHRKRLNKAQRGAHKSITAATTASEFEIASRLRRRFQTAGPQKIKLAVLQATVQGGRGYISGLTPILAAPIVVCGDTSLNSTWGWLDEAGGLVLAATNSQNSTMKEYSVSICWHLELERRVFCSFTTLFSSPGGESPGQPRAEGIIRWWTQVSVPDPTAVPVAVGVGHQPGLAMVRPGEHMNGSTSSTSSSLPAPHVFLVYGDSFCYNTEAVDDDAVIFLGIKQCALQDSITYEILPNPVLAYVFGPFNVLRDRRVASGNQHRHGWATPCNQELSILMGTFDLGYDAKPILLRKNGGGGGDPQARTYLDANVQRGGYVAAVAMRSLKDWTFSSCGNPIPRGGALLVDTFPVPGQYNRSNVLMS